MLPRRRYEVYVLSSKSRVYYYYYGVNRRSTGRTARACTGDWQTFSAGRFYFFHFRNGRRRFYREKGENGDLQKLNHFYIVSLITRLCYARAYCRSRFTNHLARGRFQNGSPQF